ncbi:hypothetical protein H5410_003932 [Solanum commersonii]|uniref:Uncharacterized protein n=1 Tax=Solanum commersonii TaxID=4109 RepID=A0A9J6B717_SOLCO|nr:hypothetical protein H5410_003932 [Solanum commersonii]
MNRGRQYLFNWRSKDHSHNNQIRPSCTRLKVNYVFHVVLITLLWELWKRKNMVRHGGKFPILD